MTPRPTFVPEAELAGLTGDATRGEAVFWGSAGCASCHAAEGATGEGRLLLTGGQRFASDFGSFVAPNISPHPEAGIGDWTLAEFVTALQEGVSPEGRALLPGLSLHRLPAGRAQDLADLWRSGRRCPPPTWRPSRMTSAFPVSIRRTVGVWNLLNLRDDFTVDGELTEQEARGRYLSEGGWPIAPNAHTPRDALGGLDRAAWMTGAPKPVGQRHDPGGLTPDRLRLSEAEIGGLP